MGENLQTGTTSGQNDRGSLGFGNLYASAGDHIGHFYRTSDEEMSVLVSFLKAGLEARDKCVCLISSGSKRQEVQEALKADGIDVERATASGQLVVDEGKSHPQELRDMLGQEILRKSPRSFPYSTGSGLCHGLL